MTLKSSLLPIEITPGVMPDTDATPSDIPCWADSLHIRFDPTTGRVRKLGGWVSINFNYGNTLEGTTRTIYSVTINQKVYTIFGTNSNLYALIGSYLTNITPLSTSSVSAANSLDTHYDTLASDPISTVDGSNYVTVADSDAALYQINDNYTLAGATTTNGIADTELNAVHVIRSIGSGTITFKVASNATSTGSGGGASVVRADGLIKLTSTAHGLTDGQRVGISSAATTGGIADTDINLEFIIRNVSADSFYFMTAGTSTSAVTGGGGTGTKYYPQIAAGNLNQGSGQGYGAGLYGVGLYGTALTSSSGETYPRIWFCDRYGDNIVITTGDDSGVYTWDGDTANAPVLISGAPTDINYAFVSDNILVTFGHSVENEIFSSDQGDYTNWTASSTNQVFQDIITGAGRFISHCPVDGYNVIYTESQTFTMKYIGFQGSAGPIWQILLLDPSVGIISPLARISINGIAYWMGQNNFYMYRGGKAEVLGSAFSPQSSILRYVFGDFNYSQRYKTFAWHNEEWDEIWWHYPSNNSNECNRIARFNRKLECWAIDMMDRTAGENPIISLSIPRLANMSEIYAHEIGANDDGSAMEFYATTKKYVSGKDTVLQTQMIPDSEMSGTVSLEVRTYNYPQSQTAMNDKTYSITSSTEKVPIQVNGRFYDYTISGEEIDQTFLMGQWYEEPQKGATAP